MPISYRAAQNLIKRGKEDELQAALANALNPNLANLNGWTLLMLAAVEGSAPMVQLLLQYGANPALQNAAKQTAADVAETKGHAEITALLTVNS